MTPADRVVRRTRPAARREDYQLTTVRADGRPHQTTIAGVWLGDAFSFTTSSGEQKAHNLQAGNHHVIVTAGNWAGTAWT